MENKEMVFINIATETKLSVQLELRNTSVSFTAKDESFIEEIMAFINQTRSQTSEMNELDLSEKLSIPAILSKDPEIEDRYLIQIKLSESTTILHAVSAQELEALLVAFKDAEIQLDSA